MSKRELKTVAMDIGNGFTKLTSCGDIVSTHPSIYAESPLQFTGNHFGLSINGSKYHTFGKEALFNQNAKQVVANFDKSKYETEAYEALTIGILFNEFGDVTIDRLVLGLPNSETRFADSLKRMAKTYTIIKDNTEYTLTINRIIVLPQPIGTYLNNKTNERLLIIDGGFGTVDITEISGGEVLRSWSTQFGMRDLYKRILAKIDSEMSGHGLNVFTTGLAMVNGFSYGGEKIKLSQFEAEKADHLKAVLDSVLELVDTINTYEKIIFTGGFAEAYKDQLPKAKNITIVENPQIANVIGFYKI